MPFCQQCGAQLFDSDNFCGECGTAVQKSTEQDARSAKEHSQTESSSPKKNKNEQPKCANCGAPLPSFSVACPFCGEEVRSKGKKSSIQKLADKLDEINKEVFISEGKHSYRNMEKYALWQMQHDTRKADAIKACPVPNTKEDIFEFMILAKNSIDYQESKIDSLVPDAWAAKCAQVYDKAQIILKDRPERVIIEEWYLGIKTKKKKAKRKKVFPIVMALLLVFAMCILPWIIVGIRNTVKNKNENQRLEKLEQSISAMVDDGEYEHALDYLELFEYKGEDSSARKEWEIRKNHCIEMIVEEAEEDGIVLEYIEPVDIRIKPPESYYSLDDEHYEDVISKFQKAGFVNITCEELKDIKKSDDKRIGQVREVSIDGETSFYSSDLFAPDSQVIIRYHSLIEKE